MVEAGKILASLRLALDELAAVPSLVSTGNWAELEKKLAWLNELDSELQFQKQLIETRIEADQAFKSEFNRLVSGLQQGFATAMKSIADWKKENLSRVGLSRQACDGLSGYAVNLANLSYYIDRSE